MSIAAPSPFDAHSPLPLWDAEMEALERLARVEEQIKALVGVVDRNREEGKHDRNNLRTAIEQLMAMIGEQNEKLGGLLGTMEQVKGAKKTLATIGTILSAIGLVGLYQIAAWLGFVKAHP